MSIVCIYYPRLESDLSICIHRVSPSALCPHFPNDAKLQRTRHFACCLGDTLASELGILSKSKPRLITTLKQVPPGTNGAISLVGTVASIAGGAFVGLLAGITLLLENAQCRHGAARYLLFETISWGMFAGLFGSIVDSLLGATVQQTRYSKTKKVVLQDDSKDVDGVNVISGWNLLTNNQVSCLLWVQ